MENVLRIGIIGLGRRWHRWYKPALHRLRSGFRISALCDQVQERAAREAKQLACDTALGPTQLLEREDIEAVLLFDTQWFGLWPLERACQVGKPMFCGCSILQDDAHADALYRQVQERRLPVMMEMMPRFAPVTARLRSLLEAELGAPRLVLCDAGSGPLPAQRKRARTREFGPVAGIGGGSAIPLLDWCVGLLGGEPLHVAARSLPPIGFSSLFLEFPGGRGVQLTRWHGEFERPAVRLQVLAERGSARVEWPSRLSWVAHDGSHSHVLRRGPSLAQTLLERFRAAVQSNTALEATFEDAYRVLRWLRVAVRSHDEGRVLSVPH